MKGSALRPLYVDPYDPVLLVSEPLNVTQEQKEHIKNVLRVACSDTRFAEKAFLAIVRILTNGSVVVPVVDSLSPNSVALGEPSFDVHVHGSGFTPESKIIFNGYEEPTTFVSETEVKTGVDMSVWLAPAVVPVHIQSADGAISNPVDFEFLAAPGARSVKEQKEDKKPPFYSVHKEKDSIKPETNAPMRPESPSNPKSSTTIPIQTDDKTGKKPDQSAARIEATKQELDITKETPGPKG